MFPTINKLLQNRPTLTKILANTGWLFLDKILRMGLGLLVGIWTTRYLGPEQFGLLGYSTSFAALFGAIATLGLDAIVIRELVKFPEKQDEFLGSAFWLKLFGGVITLILTIVAIWFVRKGDMMTLWLVAISAASFIFQSLNVIDFYFQALLKSRYTVYAANGAFLITTVYKIFLLLNKGSLIAFAWTSFFEIALTALFLIVAYHKSQQNIWKWKFNTKIAYNFLKDSWPLVFSSIAITIYMKIDQVMIGDLSNNMEVGFYAVAARLSELGFFVPMIVLSSIYPKLIELFNKDETLYTKQLQKVMGLFFWGWLTLSIIVFIFSEKIILLMFGKTFLPSAPILTVHIFSGIIVSMGVIFSNRFLLKNQQIIGLYGTIVGAVANILLNFILIPKYGGVGAAWATLISYIVPPAFQSIFFDFEIARIHFRSIYKFYG
ncbi:MAG: flippase [Candidatus Riflebacteria bacterium]|nr:flippase [Candidatus Riflebacteria bacterium]